MGRDQASDRFTRSHVVQFYDRPSAVGDAVTDWIAPALRKGGGGVLIATRPHAELVLGRLRDQGLDPADLQRQGRLAVRDAEETLARILVDGMPDAARFHAVIREVIQSVQASCVGPSVDVHAWGEMVNLLWQSGNLPAAQRMEDLWNDVVDLDGVRLLCSYRTGPPRPAKYVLFLKDLARGHTALLPHEDQHQLDHAVFQALRKNFGDAEAGLLWPLFIAQRSAGIEMPPSAAVLAAVEELTPGLAPDLLRLAEQEEPAAARKRGAPPAAIAGASSLAPAPACEDDLPGPRPADAGRHVNAAGPSGLPPSAKGRPPAPT
jgi:hypothetical protein